MSDKLNELKGLIKTEIDKLEKENSDCLKSYGVEQFKNSSVCCAKNRTIGTLKKLLKKENFLKEFIEGAYPQNDSSSVYRFLLFYENKYNHITYFSDSDNNLYYKHEDTYHQVTPKREKINRNTFYNRYTKIIKKHKYQEQLNKFHNTQRYGYDFEGYLYIASKETLKYDDERKIPSHKINEIRYEVIKCFHQGQLFYFHFNGASDSGCLYDFHTYEFVKWTSCKNIRPIYNKTTRQYI